MAALMAAGLPLKVAATGVTYLVEEQENPSTDFFVLPALKASGCRVVRCGFADVPSAADLMGVTVVFVRYVPARWLKRVQAVRPTLAGIVFFMDDDVLDEHAAAGMPWRYRLKLARLATWRRSWLVQQGAALWVSTPWLQQKYAAWQPRLLLPQPLQAPLDVRRVFYHGTASHEAEIRWLRPVLEQALRRDERLVFEIVGGSGVYKLYRGLARVTIVHPMKWPAYQAFLTMPGRHIGLAPLLDLPFNRARSHTKFFDITRSGAVGIYADNSACASVVRHGVDGLVLAMDDPESWVQAIVQLAQDEPQRQRLLSNAQGRGQTLASGFQG
jgi:hypothetical protein